MTESEVVREVTAIANSVEQAEQIRTAAEALVLKLKDFEYEEWAGNPEISFSDFVEVELTALKEALSRGWLSRGKADRPLWEKHKEQERQALKIIPDERGFIEICTLNSEQHIVPCECGHGKDQHNSLDSRPFGKWNCTYCRCVEYDAVTDEPFSGGLGAEATQRAWMKYADNQGIPHDHEDEESFKYGFDAGASSGNRKAKLEIAEEIENHSYLAGTHETCVWLDSLTKRLREDAKL